jgi:hypothetical protein
LALTVDPKNTKAVIYAQKNWLKVLQRAQPNKLSPILIKAIEGEWKKGEDFDLYGWKPSVNIWHKLEAPIYTRGILPNEILIDPDTPEWSIMKAGIDKLCKYCKENQIPFMMGFSGGKGIHVSIFFDVVRLEDELAAEIEKVDIDVYKTARRTFVTALAEKADVDLEAIRMDWGKITFNKRTQVRDFGTTRAPGLYKTLIEQIPDHKPEPYELPLIFPEGVDFWAIENSEFEQILIKALKAEVERAKKANEFVFQDVDLKGTDLLSFPCIKRLHEIGVTNGRYYAGEGLILFSKKCGISKQDAEKHARKLFQTFPGITEQDTELRIQNALTIYDTEKNFSCRVFKEHFPSLELCDYRNCPLKKKSEEKKNGDSPFKEMDAEEIRLLGGKFAERHLVCDLPDDHFISEYVAYNNQMTDGFFEYNVMAAFYLLSSCTQDKVFIDLATHAKGLKINVWSTIIGQSSVSRKTTIADILKTVLSFVTGKPNIDVEGTLESYVESLSIEPMLFSVNDECSVLLSKMGQKYNAGYFQFECKMYDGESHEKRLASGGKREPKKYTIIDPYITKFYASTFVKYARSITVSDFDSGYGFRYLFCAPLYDREIRPERRRTQEDRDVFAKLCARAGKIYDLFAQSPKFDMKIDDDAFEYYTHVSSEFNTYIKKTPQNRELMGSAWGRYAPYILKLAALIEIGKTPISLKIGLDSIVLAASMITDYFLPTLCDVYGLLTTDAKNNKIDLLISELKKMDGVAKHSVLLRKSKLDRRDFASYIETMYESGQIDIVLNKSSNGIDAKTYILKDLDAVNFHVSPKKTSSTNSPVPQVPQVSCTNQNNGTGELVNNIKELVGMRLDEQIKQSNNYNQFTNSLSEKCADNRGIGGTGELVGIGKNSKEVKTNPKPKSESSSLIVTAEEMAKAWEEEGI